MMLPPSPEKLGLSKFNFGGLGQMMMKKVMKSEHVMTISELIASAQEQGIKMIACTMSMDVMGIRAEELIDGIEYAGVATYLGEADEANVNLFIRSHCRSPGRRSPLLAPVAARRIPARVDQMKRLTLASSASPR